MVTKGEDLELGKVYTDKDRPPFQEKKKKLLMRIRVEKSIKYMVISNSIKRL